MAGEPRSAASRLERAWAVLRAAARRGARDEVTVHAAALTYYSLLSVVPLLALVFAIATALGGAESRLEEIVALLTPDPALAERIVDFVRRARVGALTGLSSAFLLYTAYSLLGSIEASFNRIWRVREGRDWWRKVADYLSVFLLTPFLLVAALGATSTLQEQGLLSWLLDSEVAAGAVSLLLRLAPFAFNVVAVGVLYLALPNRRPDFRAILPAAVLAGVALQLVQATYVRFQFAAARWELLYGALAQLPVLMLWMYWSWIVVLAGAELAAVLELSPEESERSAEPASAWAAGLHLLLRAGEAFRGAAGPVSAGAVARELGLPRALLEQVASQLAEAGFLAPVAGVSDGFVLAREPAGIDLGMLVAQLDRAARPPACDPRVEAVIDRASAERHASLRRTTLADLLEERKPAGGLPH